MGAGWTGPSGWPACTMAFNRPCSDPVRPADTLGVPGQEHQSALPLSPARAASLFAMSPPLRASGAGR